MVSLTEATADWSCLHSVQSILPKGSSRTKMKVICVQRIRVQRNLDTHFGVLRSSSGSFMTLRHAPNISHIGKVDEDQ